MDQNQLQLAQALKQGSEEISAWQSLRNSLKDAFLHWKGAGWRNSSFDSFLTPSFCASWPSRAGLVFLVVPRGNTKQPAYGMVNVTGLSTEYTVKQHDVT